MYLAKVYTIDINTGSIAKKLYKSQTVNKELYLKVAIAYYASTIVVTSSTKNPRKLTLLTQN
jgi:hypothetical protein